MNTFRKIGLNEWGVQLEEGADKLEPGTSIVVTLRDGRTKAVIVGEYGGFQYGKHWYHVVKTPRAPLARTAIGDMAGIAKLFDNAKQHLKLPAIVLSVPSINEVIRLKIAGIKAKVPGAINVNSETLPGKYGHLWYGRILSNGEFERTSDASDAIVARLTEFARDPARVAAEHGKLTGRCCFCHHKLGEGADKRSTEVGYGPDCAEHFGLPWGTTAAKAAA